MRLIEPLTECADLNYLFHSNTTTLYNQNQLRGQLIVNYSRSVLNTEEYKERGLPVGVGCEW